MNGTTNTSDQGLADLRDRLATYYTYGTDLQYVMDQLDAVDPIDVETEEATDTDWAVHRTLNYVRAEIKRRLAVQAGPRTDVDYCGLDGKYGRACGPDIGLPQCAYHAGGAERDIRLSRLRQLKQIADRAALDNSEAEGGAR